MSQQINITQTFHILKKCVIFLKLGVGPNDPVSSVTEHCKRFFLICPLALY